MSPGRRIDGDQRAAPVAERGLGHLLQLDVDRQAQVVAGRRRRARQRAHRAARGVDFDLLPARGAMQFALVRQLDADLADVVGALVVGGCVPLGDALDVVVVDAADVADDVRGDFAERILAEQPRLDLDAGKAVAIDGEAGDLLVRQARAQRQRLEVLRFLEQLAEPLAVARLHVDDFGQRVDRRVEIGDLRGRQFQRVRRIALRQHDAVAIGDHAAVGHDGHDRDAIRFRQRAVVAVLEDLQVDEAREEPGEGEQRRTRRPRRAGAGTGTARVPGCASPTSRSRGAAPSKPLRREEKSRRRGHALRLPRVRPASARAAATIAAAPTGAATAARRRSAAPA